MADTDGLRGVAGTRPVQRLNPERREPARPAGAAPRSRRASSRASDPAAKPTDDSGRPHVDEYA
jgi:hypothetical protein